MKTIYVLKTDTTSYQEYPIPSNIDDYFAIEVEDTFSMNGLQYVPESSEFVPRKRYTSKDHAKNTVDTTVHSFRLRFITNISGQETIYAAKDREAKEYLNTGNIGPFLLSEMEATNTSVDVCVSGILGEANKFYSLASSTEKLRRSAKIAIDALPDQPEVYMVDDILSNLTIGLNGILNS